MRLTRGGEDGGGVGEASALSRLRGPRAPCPHPSPSPPLSAPAALCCSCASFYHTRACTHTRTHTCAYTHPHAHTHMHMHTLTCALTHAQGEGNSERGSEKKRAGGSVGDFSFLPFCSFKVVCQSVRCFLEILFVFMPPARTSPRDHCVVHGASPRPVGIVRNSFRVYPHHLSF